MADNSPQNGTDTIRTHEKTGGFKVASGLIDVGGSGNTESIVGDAGVGLPVVGLGTAGTANSGVVTVQGIASMTAIQVADNGSSLTVDNGGTFAVQAAQSGTWNVTNVSGTVSLPTGASTAAKQPALGTAGTASADVITVQGVASMTPLLVTASAGTNLNTSALALESGGNLAAAVTALQIIDNIVSGSEAQVDIVAALPAGDAAIGRVKLTDGTDVADVLDLTNSNPLTVAIVDGSGTQITSFGGGTQYTEGDTDASITGTAMLWEDTGNTLRPVAAGTPLPVAIISGAGSGGTAAADDADFTASTTSGTPIMGVADGAASVTSGDVGVVGMTVDRKLWTYDSTVDASIGAIWTLIDAISSSGSAIALQSTQVAIHDFIESIDTKITACNTGAVVIASGTISLPTNAATETSVAAAAASLAIIDDWDETDRCKVNPIAGQAGVAGGSGTTSALTQRVVLATDTTVPNVTGNIAHDSADSGNPVKVGGKAMNAMPTAVANGDRADFVADLFGRQLVSHIDPAQQVWKAVNYTSAQTGTTIWDPTAGKRIAITSIQIGAYGTTAGRVILWFGDNADTTYTAGTDQVAFAGSFAPGADSKPGAVIEKNIPIFCNTADRELHITTDAAISLDVTVYGYEY